MPLRQNDEKSCSSTNVTLFVALSTFILTIVLYIYIPKGFLPLQDTGIIQGISQAAQSISFDAMVQKQQELVKIILQDPAVKSLSSFIGVDGTNTTLNSGRISINLKDVSERDVNASEVIRRLQSKLSELDGIALYMQPVQAITVDSRVSRTQYQYTLEDPDGDELNLWAAKLVQKLKELPELEDVATDQQTGGRAVSLGIDRVTASRLGIAPSTIDNTLYDAFGQRQINTMYTQLNQYHVILEAQPHIQADPSHLADIYIQTNASSGATGTAAANSFSASGSASAGSNALTASILYTPSSKTLAAQSTPVGTLTSPQNRSSGAAATLPSSVSGSAVPLSAFAQLRNSTAPLSINHQGQFPAVTISFNLGPRASLGQAITQIERAVADLHMPPTIQSDFQGTAASFKNSLGAEALLILAALVTVYIVLGVLYESFIHPVTILSTLPSAGFGALLALMLFHQDLNVIAVIAIILLIGIVKKNGIMMVDFALEAQRQDGKTSHEAIYEACLLRFRPIMMTTMTALLAGIPLALGTGFGSELRRPLGIAIVSGLLVSQVLTLYTTPVIYVFFDKLAERFSRARSSVPPSGKMGPIAPRTISNQ